MDEPRVEKVGFYGYISDHTDYVERNWQVGDKFDIATLMGRGTFKLTKRTETQLTWERGDEILFWKKEGDVWKWNNISMNKRAVVRVQIVD